VHFARKSKLSRFADPSRLLEPDDEMPIEHGHDSGMGILEALVCETHSAGLLSATIASAVNAFKDSTSPKREGQLKPYVPREPAIISVLRNGMLEMDLDEDTIAVVIDLFDDLGPARIAIDQYFADANHIGEDRAAALHLLPLRNTWRRACEDALVAVRQLHGYLGQLPTQYTSNSNVLIELLESAARGNSPCLDQDGNISIPELPQRRRTARRTICQPCTITHNRTTSVAFVRDVSPGGFGLERVPKLVAKSLILIELPSGRRFTGVVAWCNGTSAGVRFSRTLLPNDPLLSG
jgi:PilZ domain-containing protein